MLGRCRRLGRGASPRRLSLSWPLGGPRPEPSETRLATSTPAWAGPRGGLGVVDVWTARWESLGPQGEATPSDQQPGGVRWWRLLVVSGSSLGPRLLG